MDNVHATITILQEALLRKLGDEVELIFQYGSHIHGTPHKFSDVDISWVPAHETTWKSITVMVDGILYDFYPMHWSHLERMAEFRDVSSSVLLNHRILYQRTNAAGERLATLATRLRALQHPEARPEMLRRAMELFQGAGYDIYLLRLQAKAGQQAGCIRQAHLIFRAVLHCLAVCNQACIDTRKLEQVLALPKLPEGFAETAQRMALALAPNDVLVATEVLLQTTRDFLLNEQRQYLHSDASYPVVFDSGYPELKRDLQGVMLACERQDLLALKGHLLSLLHEMACAIAKVTTGVEVLGFNSLSEYEQNLVALGFPALLPLMVAGDFTALQQQCQIFDQRLQSFLIEHSVQLNTFATPAELLTALEAHLEE